MNALFSKLLTVALVGALAGCATSAQINRDARQQQARAAQAARALYDTQPVANAHPVTGPIVTDLPYVDARPINYTANYPISFRRVVTVNEPMGVDVDVLAQRIERMIGVRVVYQAELLTGADGGAAVAAPPVAPSVPLMDSAGTNGLPPLALPALAPSLRATPRSVALTYTGDALGLLNAIASSTGWSWDYDRDSRIVQFYRFRTETFRVPAVQGEGTTQASMGGASQGSSEGGEPISQAEVDGKYQTAGSVWKDLETTLKGMLSSDGVFTTSPSMGTITVRDRPDRIEQVRKFMRNATNALARQVNVELVIYRVVTADTDTRALNWNALFSQVAGKYGINLNTMNSRPATTGTSSLSVTIPTGSGQYGGSQIIMEALSTLGRTSVEESTSMVTANNQAVPFKVVRRRGYLKQVAQAVTQTGTGTGGIATGLTLTPGVVETGLQVYVVPHVMDDGKRVRLRIMASLSSLENMATVGSTDNFIQVPETASREFSSDVWLQSGETLVLAGFQQTDSGQDTSSPFGRAWFLGGSNSARNSKEIVVLAIRPVVTSVRSRI